MRGQARKSARTTDELDDRLAFGTLHGENDDDEAFDTKKL
jgi:hypothetical protein